LINQDELGFEI